MARAEEREAKRRQAAALWQRVADLCRERGLVERDVSASAFANPTAIGRARTGPSMPLGDRLARLADVLGVTTEWLLTGEDPRDVTAEPSAAPVTYLARPLSDVATELQTRGLLLFASTDPAGAGLTLGEALRGLEHLREQPALSNSSGVPVQGWAAFFEELRQPAKPVADRATEEARRRTIAIERGDVPAGTTSTMTSDGEEGGAEEVAA